MSDEDILDTVLDFSGDRINALSSNPGIIKHIIGCDICNSLMLEPYNLQCGHSFCGKCLESWTKERVAEATCPTCRTQIKSNPVFNLALRQLALVVVSSWNKDPKRPRVDDSLLIQKDAPEFFPVGALDTPRYDTEDEVYRCPHCSHEIEEDGRCSGCDIYFASHDQFNRWVTDTDYEESDSNEGLPHTSRARLGRIIHVNGGRLNDDEDEEFGEDEDDLGSFIDDEAEDNEGDGDIIDGEHNDTEMIGSDGEASSIVNDEDDDDDDDDDDDMYDKNDIATDTSDDSLLEETRNRGNSNNSGNADSDVEVTEVVHRPMIIDDDDDDED